MRNFVAPVFLVLLLSPTAQCMAQAGSRAADDLLPIIKRFKYGYISRSGKVVVRPRFDHASPFSGKFVITFRVDVDEYESFSGGIARVFVAYKVNYPMKIGYIDRRGRFIWKPTV